MERSLKECGRKSKWKRKMWLAGQAESAFRPQLTTGQVSQGPREIPRWGTTGMLVKCRGSLQLIKVSSRGNFAFVGAAGACNDFGTTGISAGRLSWSTSEKNRKPIFQGRSFGTLQWDFLFYRSNFKHLRMYEIRKNLNFWYATDAM